MLDLSTQMNATKERAEKAHFVKQTLLDEHAQTLAHLERVLEHYKKLGMSFEKTNYSGDALRFKFSLLDHKDPARVFQFVLGVAKQDQFEIRDCQPDVDPQVAIELANAFNETSDMHALVRGMRTAFLVTLQK